MNEIRQLRLIVNNAQYLGRSRVDAENFPKNGVQILQVQGRDSVAANLSKVRPLSKSEKTLKEKDKKNKGFVGNGNLIRLKI